MWGIDSLLRSRERISVCRFIRAIILSVLVLSARMFVILGNYTQLPRITNKPGAAITAAKFERKTPLKATVRPWMGHPRGYFVGVDGLPRPPATQSQFSQ